MSWKTKAFPCSLAPFLGANAHGLQCGLGSRRTQPASELGAVKHQEVGCNRDIDANIRVLLQTVSLIIAPQQLSKIFVLFGYCSG